MPRAYKRLTDRKIASTKTAARFADGDGLYLIVKNESSKHWVFEYQLRGERRYMGLGSARDVPLGEARDHVAELRKLKARGGDPLTLKREGQKAQALADAKSITFEQAAVRYIEANEPHWDASHAQQWKGSLKKYAYPKLGQVAVADVDDTLVLAVLQPMWATSNVTATRVRGRIETVLDWAKAMKMRTGDNPARWKGHLDQMLPAPKRVHRVTNFESMPWEKVPAFMKEMRAEANVIHGAALEFLILTAARPKEVFNARWDEIDLAKAVRTVRSEIMKKRIEHRVPLSAAAIDVLQRMEKERINEYIFPATIRGTEKISSRVMEMLMKQMGRTDGTPHGFRSSFRTWAGEKTGFAREVIEKALAHQVGDETERAYDRGDLFEKRRKLMDAWAAFATSEPVKVGDNVVPLSRVLSQL